MASDPEEMRKILQQMFFNTRTHTEIFSMCYLKPSPNTFNMATQFTNYAHRWTIINNNNREEIELWLTGRSHGL